MEARLKKFVESQIFINAKGEKDFTNSMEIEFNLSPTDHLTSLPIKGVVSIECEVLNDSFDVGYRLMGAHNSNDVLKVTYEFAIEV